MSLLNSASLVVTPNGYKAGTLYSVIPNTTLGDMAVVRATTATRVNSAGLIESVANNVPRLDYPPLGGCPSLLVEPQRTNLLEYSEQFNNAYWTKVRGVVTANSTISPDGTQNADTFTSDVGQAIQPAIVRQNITGAFVGNTNYSLSIFAKVLGNTNILNLSYVDNSTGFTGGGANYNLDTQVVTITQSPNASVTASMQDYGNGWYRLVLNFLTIATPTFNYIQLGQITNDVLNAFALWGAQLEAGSFATSYIPTTTATVTRNADEVSKTGISSLIGQTEGTIFWEGSINTLGDFPQILDLNADGNKFIQIYNTLVGVTPRLALYVQNVSILLNDSNIAVLSFNTIFKLALGYKNNDYAVYLNGVQVYVNTTIGVPPTSNFGLGRAEQGAEGSGKKVSRAALFPTRLTNAELASLTTL